MAPDPEAVDVYLNALVASGLGHQADSVAELVGPTPWETAFHRLLDAPDEASRAAFARALSDTWPKRPDLLWPLFDGANAGKDLLAARARALRLAKGGIGPAMKARDAATLYRIRRLFIAADADLAVVDAALAELGEPSPPDSTRWTAARLTEASTTLARGKGEDLPSAPPDALLAIVRRAADLRTRARYVDGAARLWAALRQQSDSSAAATEHARVLVDQERLTEALTVANDAVRLAVLPTATDVGAINATRRAIEAGDGLVARAHVHKALGQFDQARADLHIAAMLEGSPVDTQLAEQLDRYLLIQTSLLREQTEKRGPAPIEILLGDARAALERGDRAAADALVGSALVLSASLGARGAVVAEQVGRALALRAEAALRAGDPVSAAIDTSLATWMPIDVSLEHRAQRARALQAAGYLDAAFEAYADVAARGGVVDPGDLVATWLGLGDWAAAAERPGVPAETPAATVTPLWTWQIVTPRAQTNRALDRAQSDLGWSVTTPHGTLDSASLSGRVVVLTFWSTDCGACLAALPEMAAAVRTLRAGARDAVLVGVSVDRDAAAFDSALRLGDGWGTLARDPALAERLGVTGLPTTWLIDRNGAARYRLESWVGRDAFERLLERTATD
jgi:thiol-disulfide isomerase/thioredoxin/tetratricopeptide (TPR) repeat protein